MLSARAGEEGTIEGLEAGADDYLIKPFAARELLARVRANLELDRVRRTRDQLRRSQALLDQAQRLARVGSWEIDLATGAISGSDELARPAADDAPRSCGPTGSRRRSTGSSTPTTASACGPRSQAAAARAAPLDLEVRLAAAARRAAVGAARSASSSATRTARRSGCAAASRTSPTQREAEQALAAAAAEREAAARERAIADELQRSLLPALTFDPDQLEVATYYRAGRRGHAGRRRLVRRHRARRRPHRARDRRRDGARRARRRRDGAAARRGARVRAARPAAGGRARAPRRRRARARRRPDRHVRLRGLRPARPLADLRQRRAPAAAADGARCRDAAPDRRRRAAARRRAADARGGDGRRCRSARGSTLYTDGLVERRDRATSTSASTQLAVQLDAATASIAIAAARAGRRARARRQRRRRRRARRLRAGRRRRCRPPALSIDDDVRAVHQARAFTTRDARRVGAPGVARARRDPARRPRWSPTRSSTAGRRSSCGCGAPASTCWSRSTTPPPPSRASCARRSSDVHGRGLQLVAMMADALGHAAAARRQVRLVRADTDALRLRLGRACLSPVRRRRRPRRGSRRNRPTGR